MPRGRKSKTKVTAKNDSYLERVNSEMQTNQSKLSMVLGGLIVLVVGILIFNYFNKDNGSLGPAQQTEQEQKADVTPENLPGKYTVKEGDTLFLIAEKYYKDGEKFTELAKANNLTDVNAITAGQVLEIPKLADAETLAEASPGPSVLPSPTATPVAQVDQGTGTGGGNTTIWGEKLTGDTYTVVEGDWLSTIAGRAYGNPMDYQKIAAANGISNPDLIYPGQVLKLPR